MKKKLVIISGAGISKESGIPTFRDEGDGLWNNVPVSLVCTPTGLAEKPDIVHEFYNELREEMMSKEPNPAHLACVELEKDYDVTVITQNVDNLHEKAGSSHIIHLHGELDKVRAIDDDTLIWPAPKEGTTPDTRIEGHLVRPHIVMFYEGVPEMTRADEEVRACDLLIVIGTSLVVSPACNLLNSVMFDTPIFYIDPKPGKIPYECVGDVKVIQKTATEGMKELLGILGGPEFLNSDE